MYDDDGNELTRKEIVAKKRMERERADREAKRADLWADADWIAYTQASAKLGALESQENKLMVPVDFFPSPR